MSQRIDNLIDLQRLTEYDALIKQHIIKEIEKSKDIVQEYASSLQFPTIGKSQTIYIDKSNNKSYRWDDNELKYYRLDDYTEIELINGCY